MKTTKTLKNEIIILSLDGKITIGEGDIVLRNAISSLINESHLKIIINMENVKTMDSSGVGELVSAYTTITNHGGKLKLCNLNSKVSKILQITMLISVFETFETKEDALRSFT